MSSVEPSSTTMISIGWSLARSEFMVVAMHSFSLYAGTNQHELNQVQEQRPGKPTMIAGGNFLRDPAGYGADNHHAEKANARHR